MKTYSLSTELFHRKKHLFALPVLFLLLIFPLSVQAAGNQTMSEDKAHSLYQAGALFSEQNEILFLGVVQKAPQKGQIGTWTVDGSEVLVAETTVIKGEPTIGSFVELEGSWLVRNSIFKAYDLRVLKEADPLGTSGELIGIVEQMPSLNWPYGTWMVAGRKINVKKDLIIENSEKAKVGAEVALKGSYMDGVFTASAFKVQPASR